MNEDADSSLLDRAGRCAWSRPHVEDLAASLRNDGSEKLIDSTVEQLIRDGRVPNAKALTVAAEVAGLGVDPKIATRLVPLVDSILDVPLVVRSARGDRDIALLDLIDSERLPNERVASLLFMLTQADTGQRRDRLTTAVRRTARRGMSMSARLMLGLAAMDLDDPDTTTVAESAIALARAIGGPLREEWTALLETPLLELIPKNVEASVFRGGTRVRKDEKTGRNDPCLCGSGKKYKKCCIGKPQSAPGQVYEDNPARTMTLDQFRDLRAYEYARLDFEPLPTEYLVVAFQRLCLFRLLDDAERAIAELERRRDISFAQTADDYRRDLILEATEAGDMELARRQIDKLEEVEDELDRVTKLELALYEKAPDTLDRLEERVVAILSENKGLEIDVAHAFLRQLPGIGILLARGALRPDRLLDAGVLVESILDARDRLHLSPEDPSEDLLDWLFARDVEYRHQRVTDQATALEQEGMLDAMQSLTQKRDEAQRRASDLLERLREQERRVNSLERQVEETADQESSADVEKHEETLRDLRGKVEQLRTLVAAKNTERSSLRDHLAALRRQLAEARAEAERNPVKDETPEDEAGLLELPGKSSERGLLFPRFTERAQKSLKDIPHRVAASAIRLAADLGGNRPGAWTTAKRAKSAPSVLTLRVGSQYRLLFEIDTNSRELLVHELIHRRDLRTALGRYGP